MTQRDRSSSPLTLEDESPQTRELRRLLPTLLLTAYRRQKRVGGDWGSAEDAVQFALEALAVGRCPVGVPVEAFLKKTIQQIASNAARGLGRIPKTREARLGAVMDDWLREPDPEAIATDREFAAVAFKAVIAAANAKGDVEVALIVELYEGGVTDRADVAAALGLTLPQYDAARRRLDTICKRLPEALRAEVRLMIGISL